MGISDSHSLTGYFGGLLFYAVIQITFNQSISNNVTLVNWIVFPSKHTSAEVSFRKLKQEKRYPVGPQGIS
ncbi:hypothetical protein RB195_020423 [Necator americanus]|uniref:Uncharacterized protein n=1 Tax=Necator americanus TaxID=51031 RepID=A0ABR1CK85_NECAM